jgi:hypothetical protein
MNKEEKEELEVIFQDSDPAMILCNYCDCPFDTDIFTTCPVCGHRP